MKKIILMVVMLAVTLFLVVSPVNAVELEKVIDGEYAFGCVHESNYVNLLANVINGGSIDAFLGGLFREIQSDECVSLENGTEVFLTDTDDSGVLSRIRPKGTMKEYWTLTNVTKEK